MNLTVFPPIVKSPSIGVAFGGGGARGFAHINVIEALDELGVRPSLLIGTSIGSVMGAAYASGMSGKELKEYAIDSISSRRSLYARFWRTRSGNLWDLMSKGPQSVMKFNIERLLDGFLPSSMPNQFEQLRIPFKAIATDFYGECDHVMTSGHLLSALAASSCIPAVFAPVIRDNCTLIDGGTTNPVPFEYLKGEVDIVIGVDIVGTTKTLNPMKSTIETAYGASQIFQKSLIDMKAAVHKPDLILKPDVSQFRTMEFMRVREIIDATAYIKEETKRFVDNLISNYEQNPSRVSGQNLQADQMPQIAPIN